MRRVCLTMFAALAVALSGGATASADISPSAQYCYDSLRGQTGQAGDDDIRAMWDSLQSNPGVNVVQSWTTNFSRDNDHHAHRPWVFEYYYYGNGPYQYHVEAHCYVDWPHTSMRVYHDGWSH